MSDEKKKYLSIDEIDIADDTRYEEIEAWGGTIRVGSLSAEDMLDFVESNEGPAQKTAGIRLLIKSLVDADGKRIGDNKHIAIFKRKDSLTITRVVTRILALNNADSTAEINKAKNESGETATGASLTVLH